MRRSLRTTLRLGVAIVLLGSLAACGGSDGGAGEGSIEFSLTGGTVPAQVQVVKDAIADFEAQREGVTVKLTQVDWGSAYGQYQTRLQARNAPDLALLAPSWVASFLEGGAFVPVDDHIDRELLDSFFPSGYEGITDADGKRYGVPWDASIWGMFYRRDLFERAGLDPDKPPATWEELLAAAAKLKAAGINPLVFPAKATEPDDYFLPFLWQAGGDVAVKEGDGWKNTADSPEMLRAATLVADMAKRGYLPKNMTDMDWEGAMNAFVAGDAAIMYNGMWAVDALRTGAPELEGKWATARSPAGSAGAVQLGYPNSLVISSQSDNPELAAEFVQFLFDQGDPSYYFEFMKVTGVLGWTKDFADTDDPYVRDPMIQPFAQAAPEARGRPVIDWYEEFRQRTFGPSIQSLVLGDLTPEQFVEQVAAGVDAVNKDR